MSSQEPRPILKRSNPNFQDECKQIASGEYMFNLNIFSLCSELELEIKKI